MSGAGSHPQVPADVKAQVAVFDLDHTLVTANISFRYGLFLYRQGHLPFGKVLGLAAYYLRHKFFGMSISALHHRSFDCFFRGRSIQQLKIWTEQFLDAELEAALHTPAVDELRAAQAVGAHVALLSSSPDVLVEAVGHRLGVTNCLATRYRVDNGGVLCVVSELVSGQEKRNYLLQLYSTGYDPAATYAYTDSILDLPLLEAAGRPIAVRPDRQLRRQCLLRGWNILPANISDR